MRVRLQALSGLIRPRCTDPDHDAIRSEKDDEPE